MRSFGSYCSLPNGTSSFELRWSSVEAGGHLCLNSMMGVAKFVEHLKEFFKTSKYRDVNFARRLESARLLARGDSMLDGTESRLRLSLILGHQSVA